MDDTDLLEAMLRIRSHSREEADLARFLCEEMAARGARARIDAAGNAVGEWGSAADGPTIVMLGHMDTVPGTVAVRREGRMLYGRGAVDAKGPLAAFIAAASGLEGSIPGRVVVIGAVEEEAATSRGARHAMDCYEPDYAVIGEPSRWDRVTVGYKGRLLLYYRLQQTMAHSAGERPGACEVAAAFWQAAQQATERENAGRPAAIFERLQPSLRGMRSGGDGLVETAELDLGFRLPTGFDIAAWEATLRGLAGEATLTFSGHEAAVRVEKNTPLARAFLAAIRDEGGEPRFAVKTGTADLNVVAARWRCPMLAYGPGDAALDHTPHEHIDLEEYRRAIRVLSGVLAALLRGAGVPAIAGRVR